jgi:hypothetical protein
MEAGIIGNGYFGGLHLVDQERIRHEYDLLIEQGIYDQSFERFVQILEGPMQLPKAIDLVSNSFFNAGLSMERLSKNLEGIDKFGTSKHNKAAALRFKSRHKKKR